MEISQIYPPIPWRFFIVYYRFPHGRIKYFRGENQEKLLIRNATTDWVWEEQRARLFESEPYNLRFSKNMKKHPMFGRINYRGFEGKVLRSHLIVG